MTSVVGILNKRGVAIAADSAVTRGRIKSGHYKEKVTKNGNKMLRLCEADPISVMITGNADFLRTPWDVIIRRYRQLHGKDRHLTVVAATHDLFHFIQSESVFWDRRACDRHLGDLAQDGFKDILQRLIEENERKMDGTLRRPRAFVKSFVKTCNSFQKQYAREGKCPQFMDYTLEDFRLASKVVLDSFFQEQSEDNCNGFPHYCFPNEVLHDIRPAFEELLWMTLSCRNDGESSATLVISGFGQDQIYPSLVSVNVCEGFDRRVCYHIREKDIIDISDERPVAICPFAQKDVIKALLRGIHIGWSDSVCSAFYKMNDFSRNDVFNPFPEETPPDSEFYRMLSEIKTGDLNVRFIRDGNRKLDSIQRVWEKSLVDYDLADMASLADSLIDLTGFHRILTFSTEGVGGPVDVAVISKNDGFTWIRRKSWYHKDPGGKDGQFSI